MRSASRLSRIRSAPTRNSGPASNGKSGRRLKLLRAARSGNLEQFIPIAMEAAGGKHGERVGSHPQESARQSLWSRHAVAESPRQVMLIRAWDNRGRAVRNRRNGHFPRGRDRSTTAGLPALARWVQMCADGSHLSSMELLVLFEILRDEGDLLPAVTAGKLWRIGLTAAIQRTAADGRNIRSAAGDRFLDAELDWQSGLLFASVAGAQRVATCGRDNLAGVLMQSTDAAGVPSAEIVGELRNWLTTLVRPRMGASIRPMVVRCFSRKAIPGSRRCGRAIVPRRRATCVFQRRGERTCRSLVRGHRIDFRGSTHRIARISVFIVSHR